MKQFLIYVTLVLSFLSCHSENKPHQELLEKSKANKVNELANRYLELGRFSGTILISKGGTIIYHQSFGLADYENDKSFTDKTAFKIGEISELVTANIIEEMAASGDFNLSDSISTYIPAIESSFTIIDLLNHKTNMPTIQMIRAENPDMEYSTINYANSTIKSENGPVKSDLNYNILGLLIETVSGKNYQNILEDYGAKQGLENTYFLKEEDNDLAVGYLYKNHQGNGLELLKSPIYNPDIAFSSRGLKSTAIDLTKVINSNSNKLSIDGYLENDGFSYSLLHNSKSELVIVVLSNRKHPVAKEISNSITAIIENKEYQLPFARTPYDINEELLIEYSGNYALNENLNLEVIKENDSLFVMMGPNKTNLIPQSSNQFYMEQMDAAMRFLRDSAGQVEAVELLDGFLVGNKIKKVDK